MSYPTAQTASRRSPPYLNSGNYPDILTDLKQGFGLMRPVPGLGNLEYSGGGYTTIPDSWGQSQGQPES